MCPYSGAHGTEAEYGINRNKRYMPVSNKTMVRTLNLCQRLLMLLMIKQNLKVNINIPSVFKQYSSRVIQMRSKSSFTTTVKKSVIPRKH
jgi:hypothetical protein